MALTTLDRRTALIVADLQQGFAALETAHAMRHAVPLADAFRRRDPQVVLVNIDATVAV